MKRTSMFLGMLAFIFIVCSGMQGSYACFLDKDERVNLFSLGSDDVEVLEEFPENTVYSNEVVTKGVCFQNTGSVPCYIRAKYYFSTLEAMENMEVLLESPLWKYAEDGYFYYQQVLQPGEKTEKLMSGVQCAAERTMKKPFDMHIFTETVQFEEGLTPEEAFLHLTC